MENNENVLVTDTEVDNSVDTVDQEPKPMVNIAEMPIDEYIDMVISQTKEKYPEQASDEILEDVKKIVASADSMTRINTIKKYRRALKEYHKFDDIDQALVSVENTQKEITRFLTSINDSDHAQAMEVRRIMERDLLNRYGLHLAAPTNVDITNMDLAGQLDMPAIRKEAAEAQVKAHIYKVAYEAAYRRKMSQTKDNHSLTADVMEQLMHDRDTIEMSSNINKTLRLKEIDEVIDAVESPSFDIITNKTANKKHLKEIFKDYEKNPRKANNLINAIGINDAMVEGFKRFFADEMKFRAQNSQFDFGLQGADPVWLDKTIDFFIYHVARLCDVAKKRSSYKTIMYKMLILRVLEVQTTIKPVYTAEDRFTEENGETVERAEYAMRTELFNSYLTMFMTAYDLPIYMPFI